MIQRGQTSLLVWIDADLKNRLAVYAAESGEPMNKAVAVILRERFNLSASNDHSVSYHTKPVEPDPIVSRETERDNSRIVSRETNEAVEPELACLREPEPEPVEPATPATPAPPIPPAAPIKRTGPKPVKPEPKAKPVKPGKKTESAAGTRERVRALLEASPELASTPKVGADRLGISTQLFSYHRDAIKREQK